MIEENLVRILFERALKITTAESCTGGMIASTLVNVAGVSDVFESGYITYSEEAKMHVLGVKQETLDKYTVYSEEVAREMAEGAARAAGADAALSVSVLIKLIQYKIKSIQMLKKMYMLY